MLLNIAGKEAIERSRTFEYAEGESAKMSNILSESSKNSVNQRKKYHNVASPF